jgi:hypothetical protein
MNPEEVETMTRTKRRCAGRVGLLLATIVVFGLAEPIPAYTQVRVATLDELRRTLDPGDVISILRASGESVKGRLVSLGNTDLTILAETQQAAAPHRRLEITVPLTDIQSLERPRDSSRNGALIGAGVGAGLTGAMFVHALVIDRNELDEWAPIYLGYGAVFTGIGALVGWAIDSARSKTHVRFDAGAPRLQVGVAPLVSRGRGLAVTLSF